MRTARAWEGPGYGAIGIGIFLALAMGVGVISSLLAGRGDVTIVLAIVFVISLFVIAQGVRARLWWHSLTEDEVTAYHTGKEYR